MIAHFKHMRLSHLKVPYSFDVALLTKIPKLKTLEILEELYLESFIRRNQKRLYAIPPSNIKKNEIKTVGNIRFASKNTLTDLKLSFDFTFTEEEIFLTNLSIVLKNLTSKYLQKSKDFISSLFPT